MEESILRAAFAKSWNAGTQVGVALNESGATVLG